MRFKPNILRKSVKILTSKLVNTFNLTIIKKRRVLLLSKVTLAKSKLHPSVLQYPMQHLMYETPHEDLFIYEEF